MARKLSKRGRIITIVVLAVMVLIGSAIFLTKKADQSAPTSTTDASQQTPTKKDTSTETDVTEPAPPASTAPAVDPSTLSSVDVAPLGVTVFYSKGTPGFAFTILKTADNTQYAQFTASALVGTKCTDDQGTFASIMKNPTSPEDQTTISQTTKVGSDTYGLSLTGAGCTSNANLLSQYQAAFIAGFSSLKSL